MKIVIIGPCAQPHGGITRLIDNNTRWWKEWGIISYLVPLKIPEQVEAPAGVEFIDYRKYLHNNKMFSKTEQSKALRASKMSCILKVLKKAISIHSKYSYHFLKYNVALYNIINKIKPDIIYTHQIFEGLSGILQSELNGIPCVATTYGHTWLTTKFDRRYRKLQEEVIAKANLIVSTSKHCRKGALSLGANPDKAKVVCAGTDTERFNPDIDGHPFRQRLGIKDDEIVISLLGLALKRKIDTFVKALPLLKQIGNIRVLIGGIGKDFDYLKSIVKDIPFVQALGFIPEKDLPEFFNATDIFVMCPETLMECMGQNLKEAMACGTAVIGANIGGIPEAITDKQSGLLFEPNNPGDMVEKIKILIKNAEMRKRLGKEARKVVVERFDVKKCAEEALNILKEML